MDKSIENNTRVKCPYCAELIQPDAKLCRFCHSDLSTSTSKKVKPIGFIKAVILNLCCPGLAAWRLGHKKRGLLLFVIIMGSAAVYAGMIVPEINKAANIAMRTGKTKTLLALTEKPEINRWFDISFYVYIYSFIDLIFILKPSSRDSGNSK
jgi:hypothetical protein